MELIRVLIQIEPSIEAAIEALDGMIADVENGCDPEEVLYDYGLEPDYVIDLLDYVENGYNI